MRGPSALLERERELGELARLVCDVRAGAGACVLIEGAGGMGKTSLLLGARDLARDAGLRVLSARASELEREVPFGIAGRLLDTALAALSPAVRAQLLDDAGPFAERLLASSDGSSWTSIDSSHAAVHALTRLVIGLSETQPTVALVDDLQWCDAASLRWLSHLSLLIESRRILLLATTRPEGDFPDLRIDGTLSPPPLTPAAIQALVAQGLDADTVDAAFLRACCSATGGNPLYIRELVAALGAEGVSPTARTAGRVQAIGPAGVSRTVLVRLSRLSPSAVAVAKAAAVLGDEAEPAALAALSETVPELTRATIDRLVRAGIFENRLPIRFAHPILRNAIYSDIGPARRAELHRAAVKVLSAAGAAPDLVAAHILATDPCGDEQTVEVLRHTASVAMARGAPEHAATYLRRALAEPPRSTDAALVLAELGAAEACGVDVDVRSAIAHLRAALDALANPAARATTARTLAMLLMAADRGREAVGVLTRAIDDADEPSGVVALLADLGVVAMADRDGLAQAQEYLASLDQRLLGQSSPSGRLASGLASAGAVTFGGNAQAAVALARAAIRDGRLLAEETADSLAFYLPVLALLWGEDPATAAQVLSHAVQDGRRRGSARAVAVAMTLRAAAQLRAGDLAAAEEDAQAALELIDELGLHLGTWIAGGTLLETLIARGELDRASALAGRFSFKATESVWSAWLAYALASLALARDDPAAAIAHATECRLVLREWSLERWPAIPWRGLLACSLARVGTPEGLRQAEELSSEELANARRFGAKRLVGVALLRRAEVARATDPKLVSELLSEAETTLAGCDARLELAETRVALGREARRRGSVALARRWLRTGLAGARACGATSLAAMAHDELAATGLRQRRMLTGGVGALTVSERRVADLAARGLTNREIALTLFLATRTVETHLAHTYQKLAIGGRRELTARLNPAVSPRR